MFCYTSQLKNRIKYLNITFLTPTDTHICRGFKEHKSGHAESRANRKFEFQFPLEVSEFSDLCPSEFDFNLRSNHRNYTCFYFHIPEVCSNYIFVIQALYNLRPQNVGLLLHFNLDPKPLAATNITALLRIFKFSLQYG